jgi:hypothetical protein
MTTERTKDGVRVKPSLSKRGWRSGRSGSFVVNDNYAGPATPEMRASMTKAFPYKTQRMANGAWQFFCMGDEWYESDVPMPEEGEAPPHWAERVGQALPLPQYCECGEKLGHSRGYPYCSNCEGN